MFACQRCWSAMSPARQPARLDQSFTAGLSWQTSLRFTDKTYKASHCRAAAGGCDTVCDNQRVSRPAGFLLAIIMLAACGSSIKSKEKVQEAIVSRLQARSGLDLNSLDITTTAVSFHKNMAYATVAFHPKNDPNVTNGMVMKYTLEDRGGKWVVVNVGDSQGHGIMGSPSAGADRLPPGHPPVDDSHGRPTGQQRGDGHVQ